MSCDEYSVRVCVCSDINAGEAAEVTVSTHECGSGDNRIDHLEHVQVALTSLHWCSGHFLFGAPAFPPLPLTSLQPIPSPVSPFFPLPGKWGSGVFPKKF